MKKLLLVILFLLFASSAYGQQTPITATVKDPNGVPYNFGVGYSALRCPGNQQPTFNGSPIVQVTVPIPGIDGNGTFSMILYDLNEIQPTGCAYTFAICWQDQITCFTTGQITGITGSGTVNLSTQISAFSVPLPSSASGGLAQRTLPNTTLAFSATPSFAASVNASYTMTLTGNVTSSTVTGSPLNGNLLSLTIVEDSTGGRTFSFPANFIVPTGFVFSTAANSINASTWKFDGTNWNLILTGGSGTGSIGIPGLNLFYATSYGVVADVIYASSGTCANGSSAVSTGSNENPFTPASVGKVIAGIDTPVSAGGNANCPPQGTILTFVDAHHVTVSNPPANPNNTIQFIAWGTNSGSNLATAYAASYGNGCLILPSGNIFFDTAPFLGSIGTTAVNYPPCVIGQYNTNLTPLPSFNVSSCDNATKACFFRYGNITSTLPNFAYLKDFEFLGGTSTISWNLTGNFSTFAPLSFNRTTAWNLWIWNIGGNSANSFFTGANFIGPNYFHAFTVFNTGTTSGCNVAGTGGTSAGLNQMTTMEQSYCKGFGGSALVIGTGARITSYGSQFDTSACANCDTISNDGIFTSYGEIVLGASGTRSGLATTANGQSYLNGTWVKGAVAGTALNCSASGGQVVLNGAVLDATASTQPAIKTVSGCNVVSGTSNKFNASYTLNLASGTYSAPGHSVVGACTGTASSSSTLGLYGTGPNLTTSTCTSTTIGAGTVSNGGATLQNLVVFSTASGTATAAVTVLKNGSATTITCSLNGVTSCVDTTHSVALAAGDLISLQLVTGASETVANVKAQVEWN